jgi:hypothetical protein
VGIRTFIEAAEDGQVTTAEVPASGLEGVKTVWRYAWLSFRITSDWLMITASSKS